MRKYLSAMLLAVTPIAAVAQQPPSSQQLEAQLAANMARGDLLYVYDQSAWHVTDAARAALPQEAPTRLKGYVVTPDAGGYRTTFYGGEPGRYFRGYTAVWTGREVRDAQLFPLDGSVPVTADEAQLIDARQIAIAKMDGIMVCGKARPNVVVVPGATASDPVSVYIMTPQTQMTAFPLGGHNRVDVLGGRVISTRQFTRSCISLNKADVPAKGTPVGMFITHLLDPIPTEIHAFTVHAAQVPLYVGTGPETVFAVELKSGRATATRIKGK